MTKPVLQVFPDVGIVQEFSVTLSIPETFQNDLDFNEKA